MYRRLLILLALSGMVQAKNLGTWGEMYPIAEQDMLTTIQTRLKAMEASGEMAREQEAFKQRVIENTLRPKPVAAVLNYHDTGNPRVYLTLVGGGAFGNDLSWIVSALRRALNLVSNHPLDVRLVNNRKVPVEIESLIREF